MATNVRVLVVDDFEPFRRFILTLLHDRPETQVVGQASDGLEAIQKAKELQPDLILLDIGLPTLNGIEAAQRIRKLTPKSKILFVSQESSADVVQEVLRTGAWGYLVKEDVANELPAAVDAVLRGEQFVGRRFAGHDFAGASGARTAEGVRSTGVPALFEPGDIEIAHRHEAHFYSDDTCSLDGFTQFIGTALNAGKAVIVLATGSHRDLLLPRLQAHGVDIGEAIEQGRYVSRDAADILSTFMVNSLPDPVRFLKVASDLVLTAATAARGGRPRIAACGECAPLLWMQGNAEAAIRLEHLWNQLGQTYHLDTLCGYSLGSFQGGAGSHVFARICAAHSAVRSW